MRFDALPPGPDQHAGIVIGRASDTPYRFRNPDSPGGGRQVILRADGTLELRDVPFDNGQSALTTSKPGEPVAFRAITVALPGEGRRSGQRHTEQQ